MFKVIQNAKPPSRNRQGIPCIEVYASRDIRIHAGESIIIPLGIELDIETLLNDVCDTIDERETFLDTHYIEISMHKKLAMHNVLLVNGIDIINWDSVGEISILASKLLGMQWINPYPAAMYKDVKHGFYNISKGDVVGNLMLKRHETYMIKGF